ncbi:condensation domain-containing protein [Pseudomonas mosselii]|uniref:condensation domain-containing protein n=1 Tax=Pseudomonas mosselii TaxID=78327 RepID=UPI0016478A5A|nr:condensation domain-containing protein [Pseudomonas mosselii]MBC3451950.1 non ribosomal peptide synthetase BasB [Pseudomonas mosselii]MDH1655762.1 condensation domain-containing protein [Pseudomonas mosselii]MDH1716432.1 condensation domain-containing protein [Pseudomonas mosselii]MDH1720832.1 condensation domain-containing protein [Pseudomonas mosselii]
MLERNTTPPSPQALDEHEELAWFAQQQQPEQLHRQLGAWRLGPQANLSLLALAVQAVVEATPGLNSRYHFSDDGDLYKTLAPGWYPCLRIEHSAAEGMDALLRARQAAPWDSTTQPPFEALLLAGDQQAALGLLCHAVLRQSPQALLERIRAEYDALAGDQPLQLEPLSQAPSTDIAQRILDAFRQALAEPGMTLEDDFFDMGGHSLLATRIIGRLQGEHGIELRFSDFFASPSASALATRAKLSQGQASQASDQPGEIQQAPMALAQASLWRACAAFDYGTIFNLPFALDFHDPVDEALLQQAFSDLLERHASLRTTYHGEGDSACQRIVPLAELGRYKWFWTSAESTGASLASEAKHRFDLARELPLRLRLLRDPHSGHQVLSFLVHHMAIDEWSLNVIMAELAEAYLARAQDRAPQWSAPARTFHEFALAQSAQGPNPRHLAYWTELLRDATRGLALPADATLPPADQATTRARWLELRPEPGVLEQLGASARQHQSSLFSVIYTAIALSLHKLGNLSDLVIGTSASGRTDPAFFDTVGYFTTMVAHRVQFVPQQSLGDLLGDVTRMINDSMAYADVPMETIQQALGMTPAEGLMFDVYVQIHANNALNGALHTPEGQAIRYKQIDPDKSESMFGLQFEIMEDVFDGQRSLRLVVTYRSDRYSAAQVERLCAMISAAFGVFAEVDAGRRALAEVVL